MRTTWLVVLGVVVVLVAYAGWSLTRPEATVEVVSGQIETIRAFIEERAKTELPHDHLVAMPIAGWLEPIRLREGDPVTAGQVIARLDKADLADRVRQARQRIAVLETKIQEISDHRLENNALIEVKATVKAIDETVRAAEAKLEAAQAVRDFAGSEVERLRKMQQAGAAADRELRQAETEWRKSQAEYRSDALELAALKTLAAVSYIGPKFITDYIDRKSFDLQTHQRQLEEARAELEIKERNLTRAEIESPIDGIVLRRHQTRRQFLQAGTPLLTLSRLDDLEVIAEVLTQQAMRVSPGDPVEILGEGIPDGPVSGKVSRVYPAGFKKISSLGVEQQRVNVAIQIDNRPERLGGEFRVHVRIFYDEATDVLTLPRTALVRSRDGHWQVMLVKQGVTALQRIEVGLMNDERVQILDGVGDKDLVVARPTREIVEGMRVETVASK